MLHHFVGCPELVTALAQLANSRQQLLAKAIRIQQIAAPTFGEAERARWVKQQWQTLQLDDVEQDALENVYARIPGQRSAPALLISAHTDTVFPFETDLNIQHEAETAAQVGNGKIYGPGLGDNSVGVAGLLLLAETLQRLPPPPVDIWLVANSGEEGLGDLRGMRAAVDHLQPTLGACIVIEGMGLGRIVHQALGSQRYRISVHAPGGHSWSAFGAASAIHVLVQLAAGLTQLEAPRRPRTTFNIGRISGGTSINTIAQHATLELDLRSESGESLEEIVAQSLEIVARYQSPEWRARGVIVSAQLIGDRPSGQISRKHPLVQAAMQVLTSFGLDFDSSMALSSTDANVPLSRNIPAVCIGLSDGGNAHRLDEWINPKFMGQGMQQLLALTWWAAMWLAGEVK